MAGFPRSSEIQSRLGLRQSNSHLLSHLISPLSVDAAAHSLLFAGFSSLSGQDTSLPWFSTVKPHSSVSTLILLPSLPYSPPWRRHHQGETFKTPPLCRHITNGCILCFYVERLKRQKWELEGAGTEDELFFLSVFFRVAPTAYGSSQAWGRVPRPAYTTATATPDLSRV